MKRRRTGEREKGQVRRPISRRSGERGLHPDRVRLSGLKLSSYKERDRMERLSFIMPSVFHPQGSKG